jgi:hypothetical protein
MRAWGLRRFLLWAFERFQFNTEITGWIILINLFNYTNHAWINAIKKRGNYTSGSRPISRSLSSFFAFAGTAS